MNEGFSRIQGDEPHRCENRWNRCKHMRVGVPAPMRPLYNQGASPQPRILARVIISIHLLCLSFLGTMNGKKRVRNSTQQMGSINGKLFSPDLSLVFRYLDMDPPQLSLDQQVLHIDRFQWVWTFQAPPFCFRGRIINFITFPRHGFAVFQNKFCALASGNRMQALPP